MNTVADKGIAEAAIYERVKAVVEKELGLRIGSVGCASEFVAHMAADSLDIESIAMELESEFDVRFENGEWQDVRSVGDAVDLVMAKLKGGLTGGSVPGRGASLSLDRMSRQDRQNALGMLSSMGKGVVSGVSKATVRVHGGKIELTIDGVELMCIEAGQVEVMMVQTRRD